jgi:hypothetical protein
MIDELAEIHSVSEANKFLNQGWILIKSAELQQVDTQGHQITTITYVVGHIKEKCRRTGPVKSRVSDTSPSKTTKQQGDGSPPPALSRQEPIESTSSSSDLPSPPNILSLPIQWRQKKDLNPNFYYAFVFGLDGELDPVVSSVVYAIKLSSGGSVEQDGWRFTVSKDGKFLQRSRHSQTKIVNV